MIRAVWGFFSPFLYLWQTKKRRGVYSNLKGGRKGELDWPAGGWFSQQFALWPRASPGSLGQVYLCVHGGCAQLGV